MDQITINDWSKLTFFDPEGVLRALREVEIKVATQIADSRLLNLRTHGLKSDREGRDAAIFAYGIGTAVLNEKVRIALVEHADHDFVVTWEAEGTRRFCPVQLKELVPAELNQRQSLEDVLMNLDKYVDSATTVVAIKVNRRIRLDLREIAVPDLPLSQVWLFGATKPDQSEWFLYGDLLRGPRLYHFHYPGRG